MSLVSVISNLTGNKFGAWIVLSDFHKIPNKPDRFCLCQCDCGEQRYIRMAELRRGHTKSCGCQKETVGDLTGKTFGQLQVIKYICRNVERGKQNGAKVYLCRCICGKEIEALSNNLTSGGTTSCGCSYELADGISARNSLYARYRKGARDKGLVFSLSKDEFAEMTKRSCYYCGRPPHQLYAPHKKGGYIYTGIDRVDNTKGYLLENCVSCCKDCNYLKLNHTQEYFLSIIKKIYENLFV